MILSFWHNQLLAMPLLCLGKPFGISTLVPPSKDGDLTSRILRRFGIGTVRGSSSRRETAAMREFLRLGRDPHHHLALTADGPRGPAFSVTDGLVLLAQRTGKPVLPLAVSYQKYFQLKSRDGFLVPCPFTRAYFVCGNPVHIPRELDEDGFEEMRRLLARALAETNALAMSKRERKG
jgi:lysophospholipid acyltransferase (LPLAT)-like uncharacterized protein